MKNVQSSITRDDLITAEDLRLLLEGCNSNPRNEALLACAYDAGPRAGEILNLLLKHVSQDKLSFVLKVDGKTGQRPIRIIEAAPKLASWLNMHPMKNNPDAPLWPQLRKNGYGKPMTYHSARQILVRASENAQRRYSNFNKRITFTIFRHSEATRAANFMTQAQMTKRHGWTGGSKMAERYVHLNNSDVDDALFKHYGMTTDDNSNNPKSPKNCYVCGMPNSPDSERCSKCHKSLDLRAALAKEEEDEKTKNELAEKLSRLEPLLDINESLRKDLQDIKEDLAKVKQRQEIAESYIRIQ